MIRILGIPFDAFSSHARGAAQAPGAIRAALHSPASNFSAETRPDLGPGDWEWEDLETPAANPMERIESAVAARLQGGDRLISLGGDHSITYPVIKAHHRRYPDLAILHLDAHPDLYQEYQGNPHSHACPFARIMEEGLARKLVQAGIRTLNPHQREQAARFGVEILPMGRELPNPWTWTGPLYLSVDLDALDPAFAPGVSHPEPGGFSTRELLAIIHSLRADLVGADIVELNPARDPDGATARVAAKILKEILAKMSGS